MRVYLCISCLCFTMSSVLVLADRLRFAQLNLFYFISCFLSILHQFLEKPSLISYRYSVFSGTSRLKDYEKVLRGGGVDPYLTPSEPKCSAAPSNAPPCANSLPTNQRNKLPNHRRCLSSPFIEKVVTF